MARNAKHMHPRSEPNQVKQLFHLLSEGVNPLLAPTCIWQVLLQHIAPRKAHSLADLLIVCQDVLHHRPHCFAPVLHADVTTPHMPDATC